MLGLIHEIKEWIKSLQGVITKLWFGGTVFFSLIERFQLVGYYWFMMSWGTFVTK